MKIRLISHTTPVKALQDEGIETPMDLVAFCARVSNPKNQYNNETAAKLVNYLVRHKHWSPLELVDATFEIECTRDIARQMLRHRSFVFQEFCVAAGTQITTVTKNGSSKKVPIEKLYNYQFDPRMDVIWQRGIRVYDEQNKTFVRSRIKEVFETGVKPCYKVTLSDGKTLTCTEDHKLLTQGGFSRLTDLTVGDFVAVNGIPLHQDREWMAAHKEKAVAPNRGVHWIAKKAGVSYPTIRKWLKIHGLLFTKKEASIVQGGPWNKGLPKEQQPGYGQVISDETRDKMAQSARKGADSNLYKNGNYTTDSQPFRTAVGNWSYRYKHELAKTQDHICEDCGQETPYEEMTVDHLLPVFSHPELAYEKSNLRAICKNCHRKKSQAENIASRYTVRYKRIESIEYVGDKQTYDLEVEHDSHNYVADGLVSHNSGRYAEMEGYEHSECRLQDHDNRQNSIETDDAELNAWWTYAQEEVIDLCDDLYKQALDYGIAKEVARKLLPEGLVKSRLYMKGSLRSWLHYCELRGGNGTQKEHMIIAQGIASVVAKLFPLAAMTKESSFVKKHRALINCFR